MVTYADIPVNLDGKLPENITHFARALRRAGLPVGPGRVADAIRAVEAAGFSEREDFFWTLHACFVSRPEHRQVFAQIFRLYWRDPQFLEHMMAMLTPTIRGVQEEHKASSAERRAAEALLEGTEPPPTQEETAGEELIEIDAQLTFSADEKLRQMDFEQMSASEAGRAHGDANHDGTVTAADLAVWQSQYGTATVAASALIPEPSTIVALVIATCTLVIRRQASSA